MELIKGTTQVVLKVTEKMCCPRDNTEMCSVKDKTYLIWSEINDNLLCMENFIAIKMNNE